MLVIMLQPFKSGDLWLSKAMLRTNQSWAYVRKGQGVPQDYAEAVKWYRLAAEQGNADAQYNLGRCTEMAKAYHKTMQKL